MKNWNSLSKSGSAAAVLVAGVLVLTTGCVEERVAYVPQSEPVVVQTPEPPLPPPPAPVAEVPAPVPPPAPVVVLRSAAELDTMLAPVALYPDPLLAQLLPAATLPEQVVMADRYLRDGGDLNLVDAQPWDNSLKALARYPAALSLLDDNLAWTADLGQAFLNQPQDVMDSVQRLRAQALALGNLPTTPQQTVVVNNGIIEILPPTPEVIYVPVYQPEVVFVRPPPAPGRFFVSFSAGFAIGAWLNHDCDWHDHEVIVWHHDHPRPADWWSGPPSRRQAPVVVNNVTVVNRLVNKTTVVNQNITVWHPAATRTAATKSGDRGWTQPTVQAAAPAKKAPAKPVRVEPRQPVQVAEGPKPAPPKEVHSGPAVPSHEVRVTPPQPAAPPAPQPPHEPSAPKPPAARVPAPAVAKPSPSQQPPVREATPPNVPKPTPAKPGICRPAAPVQLASATPGPSTGALAGIESSRNTREASARGQQSREAMTKSAPPARSAPAAAPRNNSSENKKQPKGRQS